MTFFVSVKLSVLYDISLIRDEFDNFVICDDVNLLCRGYALVVGENPKVVIAGEGRKPCDTTKIITDFKGLLHQCR